jgi:putative ABC transport system permease protein
MLRIARAVDAGPAMSSSLAEAREFLHIAADALGRYKLRTSLSVLGVVLGVAAVIAMMSVSQGARREALNHVEALGLDNLVARNRGTAPTFTGLTAGDAQRLADLVPLTRTASPLIERYLRLSRADKSEMARVLGVRASYGTILRLRLERGRFLSPTDEQSAAQVCVLGSAVARRLFGYHDPIGDSVRVGTEYYQVVGVLREVGIDPRAPNTLAWRDINAVAMVPLPLLSGRSIEVAPMQTADEIWLQVADGARVGDLAKVFEHSLVRLHGGRRDFDLVVPRELLAQRYRTQRTFSVVVGSVAALALLVGGIGIMNIMLTSVVERTHEIGIRRTVGATRRDVTLQFLIEALLMTVSGGALGIVLGAVVSWGITAYAGWATTVSPLAVTLAFVVSFLVGVTFGLYPAIKAANLEPVDAVRYE